MARSFHARCLPVVLLISSLSFTICAQEPDGAPPRRRPGLMIGGPFGVIIGGGRGVRIGGENGAQFGGGLGARFGGDNGVQFGGGEGVRIGPRDYERSRRSEPLAGEAATADPPGRFIDPLYDRALPHEAVLHYPASADSKLQLRINGRDIELYPGDTLAVPNGSERASIQIARPIGGYGWRQPLGPGTYIFQESGRGWSIAAGTIPREPQQPRVLTDETDIPRGLQMDRSEIEQLPLPTPDEPAGREVSDQNQPRWSLFRRRR